MSRGQFRGWDAAAVDRLQKKQAERQRQFSPPPKYSLVIGVDPGITNTGIAYYHPHSKLLELQTKPFWGAVESFFSEMIQYPENSGIVAVIEAVQLNRPVFGHNESNRRKREKISQNVGENKCVAKLYQIWFESHNVELILKKPGKHSLTKLDEDRFRQLTGYKLSSSQHSRDAACLIIGYLNLKP